ncbi:uncharacterized protein LOC124151393 [Haliotis rufescens]|uniref:uncharacterized protein LOC124151393 n=1 Tax=Haliotis rufescens TaxID=6454 RepID=UPI00201E799A|nr:uncharacterized protein LOC124151393 [Haliotis rufescens]
MVITATDLPRSGRVDSIQKGGCMKRAASTIEVKKVKMRRPVLVVFLPVAAFILHLAAYFVPVWFTFRLPAMHKDIGLWFGRSCYRGKCHTLGYTDVELLFDLPVWFDVVRCLETVAVVVGFTVIACSATLAVCSREYDVFRRTSQLMFCVASFMTGVAALLAVIIFYAESNMDLLVWGPSLSLLAASISIADGTAVGYHIYRYGYEGW